MKCWSWWISQIETLSEELVYLHQTVPYQSGALFLGGQLSGSVPNQEMSQPIVILTEFPFNTTTEIRPYSG